MIDVQVYMGQEKNNLVFVVSHKFQGNECSSLSKFRWGVAYVCFSVLHQWVATIQILWDINQPFLHFLWFVL